MIELLKDQAEQDKFVNTYQNPFNYKNVDCIHMWIRKDMFSPNDIKYEATVKFKAGSTDGSHSVNAADLPSLVIKIQEFIKSLK